MVRAVTIAPGFTIGGDAPPLFFAGPCVIESREHAIAMGQRLKEIGEETRARIVYKSSFDKANRSSKDSFRGPGLEEGLDMRSFAMMRGLGCPIVYDVTHSMQLPGGGKDTGGLKQYAPILARAAAATGDVDGFFLEVHDHPDRALPDASTQLDIAIVPALIRSVLEIWKVVRADHD